MTSRFLVWLVRDSRRMTRMGRGKFKVMFKACYHRELVGYQGGHILLRRGIWESLVQRSWRSGGPGLTGPAVVGRKEELSEQR